MEVNKTNGVIFMAKFRTEVFIFTNQETDFVEIIDLNVIKVLDKHKKTGKPICRIITKFKFKSEQNYFLELAKENNKKVKVKGKFVHWITSPTLHPDYKI